MTEKRKYTFDFKMQVVNEAISKQGQFNRSAIAERYGLHSSTLSRWCINYERYGEEALMPGWRGRREDKKIKALEKEDAELRREVDILKKASAFLADAIRH